MTKEDLIRLLQKFAFEPKIFTKLFESGKIPQLVVELPTKCVFKWPALFDSIERKYKTATITLTTTTLTFNILNQNTSFTLTDKEYKNVTVLFNIIANEYKKAMEEVLFDNL